MAVVFLDAPTINFYMVTIFNIHEGGFTLTWSTDGQLIFNAPDGQVLNAEAPTPITEDVLVWLREWTHECGVDVGADSNLPRGTAPSRITTGPSVHF